MLDVCSTKSQLQDGQAATQRQQTQPALTNKRTLWACIHHAGATGQLVYSN